MEYIRTNKLRVKSSTGNTLREPTEVRLGSTKKYRLMNGNDVVWDVLQTTFSASDFSIGANGGNVANNSNVTSYGINALGSMESLGWTCDPTTISANSSTSSKTHTIRYTLNGTGDTTTAICTQAGQSIVITGYRYSASVSNESIDTAEAYGSTLTLTVSGTIYVYAQYSDGSESLYNSYGFSSTAATITSGTPESGRAYLSNGKVVVYSAGKTTYTGTRPVYYIYGYSFSVDGRSYTDSTYITVQQKLNSASDSYSTPTVSVTYGDVGANGSATSMTVTYSQTKTTTYTSEASPDTQTLSGTVSNTSTSGSVYIYSISSSNSSNGGAVVTSGSSRGNVSASSLEYTSKDRTRVLTVKIKIRANNKTSAEVSTDVYQEANRINELYQTPVIGTVETVADISASGSGAAIRAYYTLDKKTWSTANPTGKTELVANTSTISVTLSGSKYSNSTTNNYGNNAKISDSKVVADPWPAKAYSRQKVFTITSVSITSNNKTGSKNPNLSVYQAANRLESTNISDCKVSISTTNYSGSISNRGLNVGISVSATRKETYTYTSGKQSFTDGISSSAKVSTDVGYFAVTGLPTSTVVSNNNTVSLVIGTNNNDSVRTITVTAVHSDDSTVKATPITITQNAASYELSIDTETIEVDWNITTITITGYVRRNGLGIGITISNVSIVSGNTVVNPKIESVTGDNLDDLNGKFTVVVTFDQNLNQSTKLLNIKITHPYKSSLSKTCTITQYGKPVTDYIQWLAGSGTCTRGNYYIFEATLLYKNTFANTSSVSITPIKNDTELIDQPIYVPFDGSYYDENRNQMKVSVKVQTYDLTGDVFYLKAEYGVDPHIETELIQLDLKDDIQ